MKDAMNPEDQRAFDDYIDRYFSGVDTEDSGVMAAGGKKIIVE
jgi:hypothetical protein